MIISNQLNDAKAAQAAWLEKRLILDEIHLPDYDRPIKEIKEKVPSRFKTQIMKHGFLSACFREVAP